MKWMRRIHLYAGLLLLPWVLLYATTACIFNHPHWFRSNLPNATLVTIPIKLVSTTAPAKLAEEVVASIQKRVEQNGNNEQRIRSSHRRNPSIHVPCFAGKDWLDGTSSPAAIFRWGDYSHSTLDTDGLTIWTIQEHAETRYQSPNTFNAISTRITAITPF